MEITLKSRKLRKTFTFFKSTGSSYIYDSTYQPGTLGKQICRGGQYGGSTLTASDDNFEAVCRRWLRKHIANN